MSTRSYIAMETKEGFKYVYCHFDGYESNVGLKLYKYFNKKEDVEKLIDGGDFSSLYINVDEIERYNDDNSKTAFVSNEEELINEFNDSSCEYLYVFTKLGNWKYLNTKDNKFRYFIEWIENNREEYDDFYFAYTEDLINNFRYKLKDSIFRKNVDSSIVLEDIRDLEELLNRIKNRLP